MKLSRFIVLLALMALVFSSAAQFGERDRLGCPNGTHSIVRATSSTYYYVYMQNSTPQGSFSKVDHSSNLTLSTVDLAAGYLVTDFVIYNGRIYFTGDYNESTGYVGWFNIDSVFNGTGTIHYYQFKYTSSFPIFTIYYYKNFCKIKVFNIGTNIHAIVSGTRYSNLSMLFDYCLIDYQIGASSFTYAYNTSFPEHFDDIAITSSAVVTASRKGVGTSSAYMRKFPLASFSLSNSAGQKLYRPNNITYSDIHLQSTSNSSDTFFAVYYSHTANSSNSTCQGLCVNCFNVTNSGIVACCPSLFVNNQGTMLSSACNIWETAYCNRWKRLLVLQDMDEPISPNATISVICRFLYTSSALSFDRAIYWNGLSYTSISMCGIHNWITCGMQSQMVDVLIEHSTSTGSYSCATYNTSLTTTTKNIQFEYINQELTIGTEAVTHYYNSPIVVPSIYIEDCKHILRK